MFFWEDPNDFKIGDTVVYYSNPNSPKGKIISISQMDNEVEIRWEDTSLFPRTQKFNLTYFTSAHFRKVLDSNISFIKCTCGVDSVGEGKHSDYCDKYKT